MMRKFVVKYSKRMLLGLNPSGYYTYRSFDAVHFVHMLHWSIACGCHKVQEQMYVQGNIEARSCNHWCSTRAIRIIYSECAIRMLDIVICGLPGSAIFSHIFHKRHKKKKKKSLNTKCVFWFSLQSSSEIFLILRRTERRVIKICVLAFM
jgi:hypothetical protein